VLPNVACSDRETGLLAEPAADIVEGLGEMERPLAGIGAGEVRRDLAGVAFFVGDEFFNELRRASR